MPCDSSLSNKKKNAKLNVAHTSSEAKSNLGHGKSMTDLIFQHMYLLIKSMHEPLFDCIVFFSAYISKSILICLPTTFSTFHVRR